MHWSCDDWRTINDTDSISTALGVEFVDIPVGSAQKDPIRFTLFWTGSKRWEQRDYSVAIV
jgi:glucoamylase